MYIKTVILDGFKSYGQRTEITGFDKQFNAITGLNGSGKSNILDSVCFVLGITNLSQVRASNLQDLIYKSGQAGVNKATVSIIFDNRNEEQSPPGFENVQEITITRQVVIGGKNKYMINGTIVPNKKVQDLFCSVQLNVNNPHFLIMQGKITKVLNMKPYDILAMIEEAAGTKMYEVKKQAAQKTIDKKDSKLKELNTIVTEEISPKLEKLRSERAKYLEYRTVEREIESMLGLYQAWEYFASQRGTVRAKELLDKGENKIKEIESNIENNRHMMKEIDSQVEELTRKAETDGNGRLEKAEADLKEKEKEGAKASASVKALEGNIGAEEKKKKQLEKMLSDDSKALKSKEDELHKVQALFEKLKQNDIDDNEAFRASQKRYEALSAGMEINESGEAETLQEQLMNARQKSAESSTEKKQAAMQLKFSQTQLKDKQKLLGANSADYEKDTFNLEKLQKEVAALEKTLGKVNFSEERMVELQGKRQQLTHEIRSLDSKVKNFAACRPYTNFDYDDPEPNFNRAGVLGVVCRLIKVKNEIANVALETAAGGRLFNVVVDSDVTGKKLLQRGNLRQRTTFIPLNKIQARGMSNSVIKAAQDLVGKENCQPALAHLTYDKRLQVVMEFIFGNVFICKDINIARQVAFHERVRCRCVTLDGDVADPSGTLSGGAPPRGDPILKQIAEIQQYEEQLNLKKREIGRLNEEAENMSGSQQQFGSLRQQLELKQHEVNLVNQRLQQTTHYQQQEEVNTLKTQIDELQEKMRACDETEGQCQEKIKELEGKIKNSKGGKEKRLKEAEAEMKKLKQKADKSRKEWKQREQDYDTLNLEIVELKKSLENYQQQIQTSEETALQLKEQYDGIKVTYEEYQESVKILQAEVKKEKSAITEKNKDIQKKLHKKEELAAQINEYELKIKEHSHEIKKLKDDYKNMKAKEHDIQKKISKDNRFLKDAEEMTDPEGLDLEKRIRRAQETKNKLSRTVNAKAQSMFEQEESQYKELRKKQKIVEQDKNKIISVMADLDKKKENTLRLAYDQISKDFGSIFSTLLPGANAKLIPPTGQTILQGLEVKVSLGGVWKESLTELSGGQRSLAALSLILAMLLFKPAPLYILDEVDAALDLSHTQNIGNMLKSHFKKSQFIIVSLKDGMFNNANVLFRTKFVDGVSTITRSVNRNA